MLLSLCDVVVFRYELLCGETPFAYAGAPCEVIHQHLARAPSSLVPSYMTPASHPACYAMLSCFNGIVMKLLNKCAEDRYQSAEGLLFDLQHMSELLTGSKDDEKEINSPITTALNKFNIGARDWSGTFRLSQKLSEKKQHKMHTSTARQTVDAVGSRCACLTGCFFLFFFLFVSYGRDVEFGVLTRALDELREVGRARGSERRRRTQQHLFLHAGGRLLSASPTAANVGSSAMLVAISGASGIGL